MNKIYFSAYQSGLSTEKNYQNHKAVCRRLTLNGIQYQVGIGVYKGDKELCIEVSLDLENNVVVPLCKEFNQESYLVVEDGQASVVSTKTGEVFKSGFWSTVESTKGLDGYTEIGIRNTKYTIK
jgi:hypothetical protein